MSELQVTGTVDRTKIVEVVEAAQKANASVLVSVTPGDPPQVSIRTSLYVGPSVEVEFSTPPTRRER